jgi:hypothetical protein
MQTKVKGFDIATYPNGRYDMRDFTGMGMEAATADKAKVDPMLTIRR